MSAPKPVARAYTEGGGVVTRCSDPEVARAALIALGLEEGWLDAEENDLDSVFPVARATVTRGRIVHCLPGSYGDGEGWAWQFHPGQGRGATPAVEWAA